MIWHSYNCRMTSSFFTTLLEQQVGESFTLLLMLGEVYLLKHRSKAVIIFSADLGQLAGINS